MAQPGYQFGLTQGLGAVENGAAARGGLYSGAAGKALTKYGNDYATTKYGDAFNQKQASENAIWNRYSGLAGIGQTATNQLAQLGQNYANNVGNIGMSNANAQGASAIANANTWANTANQLGSLAGNWWNSRQSAYAPTAGYNFAGNGGFSSAAGSGMQGDPDFYAEGGPVQKFAYGGSVFDEGLSLDNPNQVQAAATKLPMQEQPISWPGQQVADPALMMTPKVEGGMFPPPIKDYSQFQPDPMMAPMAPQAPQVDMSPTMGTYQGADGNQWMRGAEFDSPVSPMQQPMFHGAQNPRAWRGNRAQAYADGGRVEPKIGTRSPLPTGTGGGMSTNALLQLLIAQQAQQPMQPMVGSIDPRVIMANRLRAVGEYSVGGPAMGPGGPKDDMIPARLSNGEHVVTAQEVTALGGGANAVGQQRMNKLRSLLKGL